MPLIALILIMLFSLSANALDVDVGDDFQKKRLSSGLQYWLSEDRDASPPTLESSQWHTSEDTLTFGFDERTLWTTFNIINTSGSDQTLLLDIEYPLLDAIDLTVSIPGYEPVIHKLGDTRPLTDGAILHPHILAPITLPNGATAEVMMRVYTAATLNVPMTLWNSHAFLEQSQLSIAYYVFIYGILMGIAVYHLVLFIQLRESGFLWFSLFIISLVTIFAYFQGFLTSYIWPQFRDYSNQILVWFYALTAIFCNAYILRILNVRRYRPGYARIQDILMILAVMLIIMSLFLPYLIMIRLLTLYAMISVIGIIAVQIRRGLDRYTPAYYAISAGIFCAAGMVVTILEKTGFITSTVFTRSAGDVGFAIMAILYALSLSYRMKREQEQRKIAEQETVNVQTDLLETQTQVNIKLESLVSERTSALEQANNQLKIMSETDVLTGLFNRRYFDEYFYNQYKKSAQSGIPIGILLIDVDHFKEINDTYGHPFGDFCLIETAQRIQDTLLDGNDLGGNDLGGNDHDDRVAARYGGEEFIITLPNCDIEQTLKIANDILNALRSEPITQGKIAITLTASIGAVSSIPNLSIKADDMLKQADDLLYQAKRSGRNQTVSQSATPIKE